ncbi:MAG: putative glycoside hydrolase [Gaiellaceae bacterium]
MFLRRLFVLLALTLATLGGWADRADAAGVSSLGTTRICSGCADNAGDLSRYGYVTLHAWEHARIPALKAANPNVKVLVYKDMASTPDYDCHNGRDEEFLPAGMGYCWTLANHPDWFTVDEDGKRIEWQVWRGNWQMDVGSSGYQDQWGENVLTELKRYGWDGVTVDDANVDQTRLVGNRKMREYPTQASYAAATRSFLARVGPRLTGAGYLVIPNIQADPVAADAELWADWIQFTSGGTREYWMKWGSGRDGQYGDGGWTDLQEVFQTVQRAGKIFLTTTTAPGDDNRSMRWGRASFLVGWNGGRSAFIFDPNAAVDPWSAEWTIDIGLPAAPRVKVGESVWRRNYTGGAAVVNISEKSSQTIELGGSYLTPEGAPVTSVTLQPMAGIVLRLPPGVSQPVVSPRSSPGRKPVARKSRPVAGRVALIAGRRVSGRVLGHRGSTRVAVYWRGAGRWHLLARIRTDARGRFRVARPPRASRPIRLRAVVRHGRFSAHSRVLRIRPPR